MKKILASILLTFLLAFNAKAEDKSMVFIRASINQFELGFQHNIISDKLWAEINTGLSNQDINSSFNDYTVGMEIGYNILSNKKNQMTINTGTGLYIPNSKYYSVTVPIFKVGVRYSRFFGKKEKHCLFVSSGYQYGQKDYKQTYSSSILNVSTIGTFKISPLYFSIGYGFKF